MMRSTCYNAKNCQFQVFWSTCSLYMLCLKWTLTEYTPSHPPTNPPARDQEQALSCRVLLSGTCFHKRCDRLVEDSFCGDWQDTSLPASTSSAASPPGGSPPPCVIPPPHSDVGKPGPLSEDMHRPAVGGSEMQAPTAARPSSAGGAAPFLRRDLEVAECAGVGLALPEGLAGASASKFNNRHYAGDDIQEQQPGRSLCYGNGGAEAALDSAVPGDTAAAAAEPTAAAAAGEPAEGAVERVLRGLSEGGGAAGLVELLTTGDGHRPAQAVPCMRQLSLARHQLLVSTPTPPRAPNGNRKGRWLPAGIMPPAQFRRRFCVQRGRRLRQARRQCKRRVRHRRLGLRWPQRQLRRRGLRQKLGRRRRTCHHREPAAPLVGRQAGCRLSS